MGSIARLMSVLFVLYHACKYVAYHPFYTVMRGEGVTDEIEGNIAVDFSELGQLTNIVS